MARCAVVQQSDNLVVNVIIADASDAPPDGCILVDVDNFPQATIGCTYDPVMVDFVCPMPPQPEGA